jgi:cell division protein FtsL
MNSMNSSGTTVEPLAPRVPAERRYVYNGEPPAESTHEVAPRSNRPVQRHKRSPFTIIATLVAVSMLIVFYVWTKISVDRLAVEVNELQAQNQKIMNANALLQAEINKKSTLERIGRMATQLGLTYPKEQPALFEVDGEKLEELGSH